MTVTLLKDRLYRVGVDVGEFKQKFIMNEN